MTRISAASHGRTALVALAGPALLGAALGMPFGLPKLLSEAAMVTAIVVGLSVLMIPALYIATTLVGAAPSADQVGASAASALRAGGTLLLGLAPATLFLIATSQTHVIVWILGFLVLSVSMIASLRILFSDLFTTPTARLRALPVFLIWSIVSLGLGAHLFARTLPRSGSEPIAHAVPSVEPDGVE
jgi:hypothetical protein